MADTSGGDPLQGKIRRKMAVGEGRSMMHWMNKRPQVERRRGGVTMQEVKQHNKADDCWSVYRGKVYDTTAFHEYHPGGAKYMLAAAGRDGTKLFDKHHKWVNIEFIMETLYIGPLVGDDGLEAEQLREEDEDEDDSEDEGDSDTETSGSSKKTAGRADAPASGGVGGI